MSIFTSRLRKATKEAPSPDGPGDMQYAISDLYDDPLYDFEGTHITNSFNGSAATKMKADMLPPFPIEEADDLPSGASDVVIIEANFPYTRPGVGVDDIEPMFPEGLI
jgi:hypothetical protein